MHNDGEMLLLLVLKINDKSLSLHTYIQRIGKRSIWKYLSFTRKKISVLLSTYLVYTRYENVLYKCYRHTLNFSFCPTLVQLITKRSSNYSPDTRQYCHDTYAKCRYPLNVKYIRIYVRSYICAYICTQLQKNPCICIHDYSCQCKNVNTTTYWL